MKKFHYCPNCKSSSIQFTENKKYSCSDCEFIYYQNVAGATAIVLYKGEELLLLQRNREPSKGKLDFAGGFIDPMETAEKAAIREIKEELGVALNPENLEYLASFPNQYMYKEVLYYTIDMYFLYELEVDDFQIETAEVADLVWVHKNELNIDSLAFDSHKNFWQANKKKLQLKI